ncbi:MAG: type 1 glutamine amidotransferase [Chitinivorax sp.]
MKPIAIFRFARTEGAGYFGEFLDHQGLPWQQIAIDQGEAVPADPGAYAGLVLMGGPMSVNDDLPWLPPLFQLIRQANAANVPLLGHCLGGQLISKALGGVVTRNPVKEIGWLPLQIADTPEARHWFGDLHGFLGFHWHGETFSLPPGAVRLASSAACANQAYALGKHLGMQCHVEMTAEMILAWCDSGAREIAANPVPTVQQPQQMQIDMQQRLEALHAVADRLYTQWTKGLAH